MRAIALTLGLLLAATFIAPPIALGASAPAGYSLLDGARNGAYLLFGSRGPAVSALQRALGAAGFPVAETGVFDRATDTTVRAFQRWAQIVADGIVGPNTVKALDKALGIGQTPPPAPAGSTTLSIPARDASAPSGSQFLARTAALSRPAREDEILRELLAGNVPAFQRALSEVRFVATDAALRPHDVRFYALPDYLALGRDDDFLRIPMNPLTAQRLADAFGASLPTTRMVDLIWQHAAIRVAPAPIPPSAQMMSNDYFARHQRMVDSQLADPASGRLTAGDKKDVVISNVLAAHQGRVAIYGWTQLNGRVIQPLSTVHENTYADYSHGIRMVAGTVLIDGQPRALADVLRSPTLAQLLSSEGVIASPRQPGVP